MLAGPKSRPTCRSTVSECSKLELRPREGHYEIYQRENIRDPLDYSCGIVYLPLDGTRLTLARYNGSGHEHGDIEFRPPIHSATPEAIAAGVRPEREAQATERYATSEGALACLVEDFRVDGIEAKPDQQRLAL